ncbi:MAG: cupin domain-containing protein [Elusimicrobiota bacterium]|nr:cupin domain-containing protein [Elusimicrobiota bacterium]
MLESFDARKANPYGESVSTLRLNQQGGYKLVSLAIPAGKELAEHSTPVPATLVMLEGEARFIVGAEETRLTAGGVVPIAAGEPHRIVALRDSHFLLAR